MCAIDATTSCARTSCGHSFHFGCLATWANRNANCPLCRASLGETDQVQQMTPEPSFDMVDGLRGYDIRAAFFNDTLPRPGWTREVLLTSSTGGIWETLASSALTPRFRELLQGEGWRRNFATDMMRRGSSRQWRRTLQTHLETFRANRPPVSPRQELHPIDVEFVMDFTHVTQRRAEAYLRFFRDPIETVMCLMHPCDDDPIPGFQERERPPLAEPYVSRYTGNRNPHGTDYRDGYESA